MIVEFNRYMEIDVSLLEFADWNYKTDDDFLAVKLENNIKKNGQIQNILVREIDGGKYEVVNGNHRLKILLKMDVKKAVCYNLGKIDVQQAKRIAIETNETEFDKDDFKLVQVINNILNSDELTGLENTLPYTADELQNFRDLKDFDWDKHYEDRENKYGDDDDKGENSLDGDEKGELHKLDIVLSPSVRKKWGDFKSRISSITEEETFVKVMSLVNGK